MLQQTTVAAVIPLYERWMERFPTLESLAETSSDQVMEAWSGLGYYSRASRLHQTAQLLRDRASYPENLQDWLALPGLGPYTAAAVASIAFGLPHLALDTNVLRVLLRFFGWKVRADNASAHQALREAVEPTLSDLDFGQLNQALMELGATLCRIRAPLCHECPLNSECVGSKEGTAELIPLPKPKVAPRRTVGDVYLLGENSESAVLVQGTSLGLLGQLYQPLIDLPEENRTSWPWNPLCEKLRSEAQKKQRIGRLVYGISGRRLELDIYRVLAPHLLNEFRNTAETEGLPIAVLSREPNNSGPAVSSLTRKIAKVWAESP